MKFSLEGNFRFHINIILLLANTQGKMWSLHFILWYIYMFYNGSVGTEVN